MSPKQPNKEGDESNDAILSIVEAALLGERERVIELGSLLAERLEQSGEVTSADRLRKILEGRAGARIVPH
jgi:hypothetical protein